MGRPITSWEQIIGHKNVCRFIRNSLEKNTVRDVILFYGNSGLGKTSIAKLMACHLIAQNNESLLKRCIQEVILENKSNEFIKIIGMTDVGEKEDEIAKVKQELSLGFSTVGRKVVIIDEVQGMTKKAQDGLLTELEALQDGIYVFMCTNDVTRLQDALFSRCRSRSRCALSSLGKPKPAPCMPWKSTGSCRSNCMKTSPASAISPPPTPTR